MGFHMRLAKRIKELRDDLDVTQEELAPMAGVSLATIQKIEQGSNPNPSLATINKIASAAGVPAQELIGLLDPMPTTHGKPLETPARPTAAINPAVAAFLASDLAKSMKPPPSYEEAIVLNSHHLSGDDPGESYFYHTLMAERLRRKQPSLRPNTATGAAKRGGFKKPGPKKPPPKKKN